MARGEQTYKNNIGGRDSSTITGIFTTHGIPYLVMSDNGPQFASQEFKEFGRNYNFNHMTTSPNYPAANEKAERSVRTVKEIFKKSKAPYLALLTYRTTPLQNGLSPSELIMGRKLRTPLLMMPAKLDQKVPKEALEEAEKREANYREKQAKTFDEKHRSILLPQLCKGDSVWVRDQERDGIVVEKTSSPRSYLVETEKGIIRRNRSALVSTHSPAKSIEEPRLPSSPHQTEVLNRQHHHHHRIFYDSQRGQLNHPRDWLKNNEHWISRVVQIPSCTSLRQNLGILEIMYWTWGEM